MIRDALLSSSMGIILAGCGTAATAQKAETWLAAPLLKRPPTIDGTLAAGEWDAAAACTGFERLRAGAIAEAQPVFFAAHDAEHLYVALRLPCPDGSNLVTNVTKRDGPTYEDDSVEVFIAPDAATPEYYQFVVTAGGVQYDGKGMDGGWNAQWRSACGRERDAWVAEFAIPWRVLGLAAAPQAIGLNLTWNCQTGRQGNYTWARMEKSFHEPRNFARLQLRQDSACLRLTALTGWQAGTLQCTAASTGGAAFSASLYRGQETIGEVTIGSGDSSAKLQLPREGQFGKGGAYALRYRCGELAQGQVRFTLNPPLDLTVTQRMLAGLVDVKVDVSGIGKRAEGATLELRLTRVGTDEPVRQRQSRLTARSVIEQTLDLRDLPAANYRLHASARSTDGRELTSTTAAVRKPETPEWLGCREGITDRVFEPWTPVEVEERCVRVWGREYEFGAGPWPTRILTRKQSILSGPIAFTASVDGIEQRWTTQQTRTREAVDDHVLLDVEASSEQLRIAGTVRVEYDGMARLDLRVMAPNPEARTNLQLVLPLKAEYATYLYHFPGRWGSAFNAGALPEEGWTGSFRPYVWLGDEWRGLAWFCEDDRGWHPKDPERAVEIVRRGETVVLRLDLLHQVQLSKPVDYTFGLQATPVKPAKPDVWDYRIVHRGRYGLEQGTHRPCGSVTWPARGNVSLARGTFECWLRPEFDPNVVITDPAGRGIYNQHLFSLDVAADRRVVFYWNIDDRGMRAFVQTGPKQYPAMIVTHSDWKQGEWHHVALSWGDELVVRVDGKRLGQRPFKGLLDADIDHAVLRLGFDRCEFTVDELRISNVSHAHTDLTQPHELDANTLLLERFDQTFLPDETQRTKAEKISAASGVPGGLPSANCAPVAGRFGSGMSLCRPGSLASELDTLAEAGARTICFHEHWTPVQDYHVPGAPDGLHRLVKGCHKNSIQLLLYWGYEISNIHPDWAIYSTECLAHPRQGGYHRLPEQHAYIVCYNGLWQDYIAWSIANVMDTYGIDGVYLDGTAYPWACDNVHHGCGYVDAKGQRRPTYPIFAVRQMMRRIYAIVKSRRPDGQVNVHNSTMMVIPTLAWATSTWDGEQFGSMERGPRFDEVIPLDAFRAEFMGHQWGVPAEFLCYDRPYTYREALAFTLLHDVLVRPGRIGVASGLWHAMDEFGRSEANWLPYWENQDYVTCAPAQVKASLYSRGSAGVLLVVSNLSDEQREASVSLQVAKLQLPAANLTAVDAMNSQPLELAQGKLKLILGPMEWRLVRVQPR